MMTGKFKQTMKRLSIIIYIVIITLCIGCNKKEESDPEFFKLDTFTEIIQNKENNSVKINEVYVISNPPSSLFELRNIVDDYCDTLPKCKNEHYEITRHFYEETRNTPRGYAGGWDTLFDRTNDCILVVSWLSNEYWKSSISYGFYKNEYLVRALRVTVDHNNIREEMELATPY